MQPLHEYPLVLIADPGDVHKRPMICNKCERRANVGSFHYCTRCGMPSITIVQSHFLNKSIIHIIFPTLSPSASTTITSLSVIFVRKLPMSTLQEATKQNTCAECNFHSNLNCALLPTITGGKHSKQPLCHLQPMALVENHNDHADGAQGGVPKCFVCQSTCVFSTSTFVCTIL